MIPKPVADVPPIGRAEATVLATTEYGRFADLLRALPPDAWDLPTDCTRWSVKDVAAHIVGETEAFASLRELVHQWRPAARVAHEIGSAEIIDGVNEVQVRDRRTAPPAELVARLVAATPGAIRTRARLPRPVRALRVVAFPPPLHRQTIGYLVDRVITREVWMHRVDIARAADMDLVLTAGHDGRIVADVVADWAGTHPDPFLLTLTGPAGGTYRRGEAPAVTVDAVDFVRIVSGRDRGEGVLTRPLPL